MLLGELTWPEVKSQIRKGTVVVLPIGATEGHGPHCPLDTDINIAFEVARRAAARAGALVAPPMPYGYSTTWMHYAGTMTLELETFIRVVFDLTSSLVRHGFKKVLVLNGHRPNGTALDAAARLVVDKFENRARVAVLSYWEIAAKEIHALRRSAVGGMGHACEFETSVQLHLRPTLVHMRRLKGLPVYPVQWDLVADPLPVKVYSDWPEPRTNPGFFGDPHKAGAEIGQKFLEVIVGKVATFLKEFQAGAGGGTYERRSSRRAGGRGIRR